MIAFSLTDDQKKLAARITSFAEEQLNPGIESDDRLQRFPVEKWKRCGELGLQGLCIPEAYGGSGLDALSGAVAFEALGYACHDNGLNFSLGAHLLACALPLLQHGSEEQKKKYLPALCTGEMIACNAMTEPGSGSDAFQLSTTAVKKEGSYRVSGNKHFITNAPVADVVMLYALTDREKGFLGGVSAFVMESGTPGLSVTPIRKLGLHTSSMGGMSFTDLEVPASALLGKEGSGAGIFTQSMNWERALLAALHAGSMRYLVEYCAELAGERPEQGVAFLLADMAVQAECARLMAFRAAAELGRNPRASGRACSMAKIMSSENLVSVCHSALRIAGQAGCREGHILERYTRDAIASRLYSGTNEIQRNLVANFIIG